MVNFVCRYRLDMGSFWPPDKFLSRAGKYNIVIGFFLSPKVVSNCALCFFILAYKVCRPGVNQVLTCNDLGAKALGIIYFFKENRAILRFDEKMQINGRKLRQM